MSSILTRTVEHVTILTLNRPEKLNAFSGSMREELAAALRDATGRVVVITGAGRAFCAGGDVTFMSSLQKSSDVAAFRRLLDAGRDVVQLITGLPKPVIASIHGVAAGAGCNLALACDYRIASDQARFAQSFVRIGLHPDWGGTWFLPRVIGRSAAFEMMSTGRLVEAAEAARMGLIDRLVSAETLEQETLTLARTLAAGPPEVLAAIKRSLAASERNDLATQLELETENQVRAFQSPEASEGLAAFAEKRSPKF